MASDVEPPSRSAMQVLKSEFPELIDMMNVLTEVGANPRLVGLTLRDRVIRTWDALPTARLAKP